MIELLIAKFLPYIIGVVGAVVGILLYGKKQKAKGKEEALARAAEKDRANAKRVKEKVDAATRDGDAVERLREAGRLRDGD